MEDAPAKTRHAVEMALATTALVAAASTDHRKRVLARYVFVYLHDVERFGAAWRNELARTAETSAAARSASAAHERLRRDWGGYQEIRHYLAAKRAYRESDDAAADQLASFELWADAGALAVETLTEDAAEFYAQLSSVSGLDPIDFQPTAPDGVTEALNGLDPLGAAGFLEANAGSFGAAKGGTFPIRMGGEVGRLIPLINDVAENAQTLRAITDVVASDRLFDTFVRCQLPSELDELLRLTAGPVDGVPSDRASLYELYDDASAPPDVVEALNRLRALVPVEARQILRDWRNRIGAHIDDQMPWSAVRASIDELNFASVVDCLDHVLLFLESVACQAGGPAPLLLPARRVKAIAVPRSQVAEPLSYDDPDSASSVGALQSALVPEHADSPYVVWVGGPGGSRFAPAVAGMIAGRARDLNERLKQDEQV